MVSLILSLDIIDKERLDHIQEALHYALELPDRAMFDLLLSMGVNPNYSMNEELHLHYRVRPIFYEAIKKRKDDQVDRAMSSLLVKLNQERSCKVLHSPLMVAIANRNEKAARKLIASCRVSLQYSAHESDDYPSSLTDALKLANKNGLFELVEIIDFFQSRLTLIAYIRDCYDIALDGCILTEDENHEPTIHCYSRKRETLEALTNAIGANLTVRQNSEGLYYVRLGKLRLQKLIKSKAVTNFLLSDSNNSPIFESVFRDAEKLLVQLRENTVTKIDLNTTLSERCFLENGAYRTFLLLLGENSSLEQISLNHDGMNFLDIMSTLHRHPGIKHIHFTADIVSDMCQTEDGLSKLTTWLASFSHLESVTFDYLPLNLLSQVIDRFAKFYDNKHLINLIINEQYSDDELVQISDMMEVMEVLHELSLPQVDSSKIIDLKSSLLLRQDECFQNWDSSDKINNHCRTHFMKVTKNKIYYQSVLTSEDVQELTIKYPGFDGQATILDRIFTSHPEIKSITIDSNYSGLELAELLHFLNQKKEISSVTHLSMSFCSLNAESLAQLTSLLHRGKFHYINFSYTKITIGGKDRLLFEKFVQTLSNKDSLQVVKFASMKATLNTPVGVGDLRSDVLSAVMSSLSIISADFGYGALDDSTKLTMKVHLSRNASLKRRQSAHGPNTPLRKVKRNSFFQRGSLIATPSLPIDKKTPGI